MILLIGDSRESGFAYLARRLRERDSEFACLDAGAFANGVDVSCAFENGSVHGELRAGDRVVPLDAVGAAFVHYIPRTSTDAGARLLEFVERAPFFVCNRPSAAASNFSKTYQQLIIAAQGFAVPRTIVTNRADDVRAFYERCRGRVIYKSASSWRSAVRRLSIAEFDRLERVANCPTQFQEWIPGTDVRVHVVGEAVFATEIASDAVDYRFGSNEGASLHMRAIDIPESLARRCVRLAATLNLAFAGIDLRRHVTGEYYCFEANPSPAFAFYQQGSGQRIGDAVVDLLCRENDAGCARAHPASS